MSRRRRAAITRRPLIPPRGDTMTPDPARRIANRRKIIADLRQLADTAEREAAELREKADRLRAATDALEAEAR